MHQSIEREITTSGSKSVYDEFAKRLLAQKVILAHILIHTIKDFSTMKPEEVMLLIEGEPEVAHTPALPGQTNNPEVKEILPVITGNSTESKVPYEGIVTFDIRFYVWLPGKKEKVKVIVDVEAQKKFSPGYDLVTRGIFYASRLVSAQLDTEFTIPHYNDIKKVYSIWICADTPKRIENTITEFCLNQKNIVGEAKNIGRYDLLSVIMVGLPKELTSDDNDELKLHRLLGTLLEWKMEPKEKKKILSEEFDIPMTEDLEGGIEYMCNLSEAIAEENQEIGIEIGKEIGKEAGRYENLYDLITKNILSLSQAAASVNLTVDEFVIKLKKHKLEL